MSTTTIAGTTRPDSEYVYTVNVYACIESNNTLRVFWETPDAGFSEKITTPNWDGSAKSTSFQESDIWCGCCGAGSPPSDITLTATAVGTDTDGSTIVQIDWSIAISGCYVESERSASGSYEIIVTKGMSCFVG